MEQEETVTKRRGGRIFLFVPVVLFAGFVFLLFLKLAEDPQDLTFSSAMTGKPVPQFSLLGLADFRDEKGRILRGFSPEDLRIGKPILLNIWASWCPQCRQDHPILHHLAEEGFLLYGVAYKDSPRNVRSFLTQYGNPFQKLVLDPKGVLALDMGVRGVPETFLIGGDGVILKRYTGMLTPEMLEDLRKFRAGQAE